MNGHIDMEQFPTQISKDQCLPELTPLAPATTVASRRASPLPFQATQVKQSKEAGYLE
jgi:hypothetical protein